MADRYWVGGTSSWDGTAGSKWATTSGGAGGASIPTSSDDVYFDANSGSGTVTISTGNTGCKSFNTTGFTGTVAGTGSLSIYGYHTWGSGITRTYTGAITYAATSGTNDITLNGKSIGGTVTFNGIGGTWRLMDAFTSSSTMTLTNGTLDANNNDVTITTFTSSASSIRTLTMGNGQWTLTGNNGTIWNTASTSNFTLNRGSLAVICNYSGSTGSRTLSNTGEAYAVDFKITAGTDTIIPSNIRNMDFTGFSGALTTSTINTYGGVKFASTMTIAGTASPYNMIGTSGSWTIDSGGLASIDRSIGVGAAGSATYTLVADLTLGSTRAFTFNGGTFDMDVYDLSTGTWNISSSNTRTYDFGSGAVTVTGSGTTLVTSTTTTGLTVIRGAPITSTYSGSTGTRTFSQGANEATVVDLIINNGTDTVAISTAARDIDFTGFSGTMTNSSRSYYGNLTLSSGMTLTSGSFTSSFTATSGTKVINTAGKTFDFPVSISCLGATTQLANNLTMPSTRTLTLTSGTFDANGYDVTAGVLSSSNSNTRSLIVGSGAWSITSNNTTVINFGTATGFTLVPGSSIKLTYSGSTGSRTISTAATGSNALDIWVSDGSDTIINTSGSFRNFDFTGFAGVLGGGTRSIYGSFTVNPTMTITGASSVTTFTATSGTHQIRSNGATIDFPITINAPGAVIELYDALTLGSTRALTLTAGTLDGNDKNVTAGSFSSTNSNVRGLVMGDGTTWSMASIGTIWNTNTSTNMTLTPGTSTIQFTNNTSSSKAFDGGGLTYYNFTDSSTSSGATTMSGNNTTFNKITLTQHNRELRFFSGQTFNVNELDVDGDGTGVNWIRGTTNQFTLVNTSGGDLNMDYVKVEDMIASPQHSIKAGKNSYSFGGNRGVDFYIQPGVM